MNSAPRRLRLMLGSSALVITIVAGSGFQQSTASGEISGTVLDGVTHKPVPDARVMLMPIRSAYAPTRQPDSASVSGRPPVATVGSSGKFVFKLVVPGKYVLAARAAGYSGGHFGQQNPNDTYQYFDVRSGESVTGVELLLWPGGSIGGRVTSEAGKPAVDLWAQLLEIRSENGRPRLFSSKPAIRIDDRGAYNFEDLPTGRYLVRFSAERPLGLTGIGPVTSHAGPSKVYFPNSSYPTGQGIIHLAAGEQRADVNMVVDDLRDFQHRPTQRGSGVSVTGRVVGLGSPASQRISLSVRSETVAGLALFDMASTMLGPDGSFAFRDVPPGDYKIRGLVPPGSPGDGQIRQGAYRFGVKLSRSALDDRGYWISQGLSVADQPLGNLIVRAHTAARVSGRIVPSGDIAGLDLSQLAIMAESVDGDWDLNALPIGWVEPDGRFVSPPLPPGRYSIFPSRATGWFVESEIFRGKDVAAFGLDVGETDLTEMVINLSGRIAELKGRVVDGAGRSRPDARIIFFKRGGRLQTEGTIGIVGVDVGSLRADRFGGYLLQAPAGEYLVAAIAGKIPLDWQEDNFLRSVLPSAIAVSLARGASVIRDLQVQVIQK